MATGPDSAIFSNPTTGQWFSCKYSLWTISDMTQTSLEKY